MIDSTTDLTSAAWRVFLIPTKIDEKRAKELKLAVSAQNALVKAFHTKTGYHRLIGTTQKLQYFKEKKK